LNSIERLGGSTTIRCGGKDCSARYEDLPSAHASTGIRAWSLPLAFAVMLTVGQIFAYSRGMRPALDYAATGRPRITRRHAWGILVRTLGYTVTALLCSALVRHVERIWSGAIRLGLVIGIVTGVGTAIVPMIEYFADNLPERRLGAFGIGLILCGFALQSFQYWVALLDVRVT
jgi:hypothetical protein